MKIKGLFFWLSLSKHDFASKFHYQNTRLCRRTFLRMNGEFLISGRIQCFL
jgi:hypothetical protein